MKNDFFNYIAIELKKLKNSNCFLICCLNGISPFVISILNLLIRSNSTIDAYSPNQYFQEISYLWMSLLFPFFSIFLVGYAWSIESKANNWLNIALLDKRMKYIMLSKLFSIFVYHTVSFLCFLIAYLIFIYARGVNISYDEILTPITPLLILLFATLSSICANFLLRVILKASHHYLTITTGIAYFCILGGGKINLYWLPWNHSFYYYEINYKYLLIAVILMISITTIILISDKLKWRILNHI